MAQQQRLPFARLQALAATSSYRDSSSTNSEISTTPSEESAGTEGEPSTCRPNELRRKRTNKSNQQKPRTSWVFNHIRDEDREKRYLSDNSTLEWRCKYCTQTYELSRGTYIITKHLTIGTKTRDGHGLTAESPRLERAKNQQAAIDLALLQAEENPKKRRRIGNANGDSLNPGIMEILWVNVLAACSLAFRLSDNKQFRTFLEYLNPDIEVWFPPSHSVIQGWVMRQFADQKLKMKEVLLAARSRIHISCDLWTSPNSLAILGIIAHFVDKDGTLQAMVLALKSIVGDHTGESLVMPIL